ncbi:fumarylacetoacetate hydrolase family protein [bacterium]|nr:fumarylacetoacetate hydrolase family protein [bacterium]
MKLVTFLTATNEVHAGAKVPDDGVIDLTASLPGNPSMLDILGDIPRSLDRVAELLEKGTGIPADVRRLLPPIPTPGKIICIGLNYRDHAEETKAPIPSEPIVFSKFTTSIIGPEDPILLPPDSTKVDYEAELVVVIGEKGRYIPREKGLDHVAGYMAGHDVSARDWQTEKPGKQWLLGKSFDTFAPIGPWLVTKEEIPDPQKLAVLFRLNGEVMQSGSTEKMIFSVAELVAHVSRVMTLLPGDIIFTGTPPGVGMARNPQIFLKDGDLCEVEIDGLGTLRNRCQSAKNDYVGPSTGQP